MLPLQQLQGYSWCFICFSTTIIASLSTHVHVSTSMTELTISPILPTQCEDIINTECCFNLYTCICKLFKVLTIYMCIYIYKLRETYLKVWLYVNAIGGLKTNWAGIKKNFNDTIIYGSQTTEMSSIITMRLNTFYTTCKTHEFLNYNFR